MTIATDGQFRGRQLNNLVFIYNGKVQTFCYRVCHKNLYKKQENEKYSSIGIRQLGAYCLKIKCKVKKLSGTK